LNTGNNFSGNREIPMGHPTLWGAPYFMPVSSKDQSLTKKLRFNSLSECKLQKEMKLFPSLQ